MSDAAVTEQPQQNENSVENKTEEPAPATETTKEDTPKVVKPNKKCVHKTDFEKDVVYLYQFGRCPVIPQVSPFCFKVETWLRMSDVKYQVNIWGFFPQYFILEKFIYFVSFAHDMVTVGHGCAWIWTP